MSNHGRLYGVGLGPGDPELITRKAARLICEADVIAYHSGIQGRSIARSLAAELISSDVIVDALLYPVTTGTTDHPGGYDGAIAEFHDECLAHLAAHLDFGHLRNALALYGRLDDAVYVERASINGQRIVPVRDVDTKGEQHFSVIQAP